MIAVVVGTKAEYLRLTPLMKRLKEHTLILTNQNHVEPEGHANVIQLKGFQGTSSMKAGAKMFFEVRGQVRKALKELKPEFVVYQGDTVSTLIASMASQKEGFKGVHVEAGFRSGSIWSPFPEELCRRWTDNRSEVLSAPSMMAFGNLIGKDGTTLMLSGSTVWDNLTDGGMVSKEPKGYVVMTAHRYETILSRAKLKALIRIAKMPKLPVVWPMHEMTRKRLGHLADGLAFTEPMDYPKFMETVAACNYVITDGGGLEDEACFLRKPCILLRSRTERPEAGSHLVGLDERKAKWFTIFGDEGTLQGPNPYPYYFGESPSDVIARLLN